ncbi:pancreatic triacylglycerol lipase-like [Hermetia illucens]|nr:pancreatic triacylglycerol lipase-like [Hermetia illucens]
MRAVLVALLLGLTAVLAYPANNDLGDYIDEWVLVPDVNYNMHLISVRDAAFQEALTNRADFKVDFILFTKDNPKVGQYVTSGDADSLKNSNFNPKNPTRFLTHGWNGNKNAQENAWIRDKYLARGEYNIFVVDWEGGAKAGYLAASKNTKDAGEQLANFVDFLNEETGMSFNTLYLIGHSLGSHVVGYAGKYVTRGKVNTIFGLDPALPLFAYDKPEQRLAVGDALYVESIQTNGGMLGYDKPIGDAAFFPNWGRKQPGCTDVTGGCSHTRSCQYFAESLDKVDEFVAEQCRNYDDILDENCQPTGEIAKLGGEPSNQGKGVAGVFYLPTNSAAPYAKGASWIHL